MSTSKFIGISSVHLMDHDQEQLESYAIERRSHPVHSYSAPELTNRCIQIAISIITGEA